MPYTVNGCGTMYYGRRDEDSDGSYVTTQWITLVFFPLIPIGSYRVRPIKSGILSSEYHVWKAPFQWKQVRNIYLAELSLLGIFTVASVVLGSNSKYEPSIEPLAGNEMPVNTSGGESSNLSASPKTPKVAYVRPKTADNGQPFPATSGYIKKYSQKANDGYSSLTIKNDENDSDVFVKVFDLNTSKPKPVRFFFVRAHESFTAEKITPGKYDVRYRDLDSGGMTKTQDFQLTETETNHSVLTMTLYKVADGNMQTEAIGDEAFK
jgi:hypothetical protein